MILSHSRTTLFRAEGEINYREVSRENLMESTKRVDFGPVLGIGFEAKIFKKVFFIEGRYNLGVNDLLKSWYYSYRPDIKTCTLQIMAGFKI
jgi:hypothetical protein